MAELETAESSEETKEGGKSNGMMGKLLVVGFMLAVVGVECALAYFLIPDAEDVAKLTEDMIAARLPETLNPEDDDETAAKPTKELELGDYSVTVRQANSSTSLRVDFKLAGVVLEDDFAEAQALYDANILRFQDQIITEIRNSEPADLDDPALGLIKRRILEKSTEIFRVPLIKSIQIPQFSYIEQ